MKKLIKVLVYLDIEEGRMPALIADVKSELLRLNELYKKYGVCTIKVTTDGFDRFRGKWGGWDTPVK